MKNNYNAICLAATTMSKDEWAKAIADLDAEIAIRVEMTYMRFQRLWECDTRDRHDSGFVALIPVPYEPVCTRRIRVQYDRGRDRWEIEFLGTTTKRVVLNGPDASKTADNVLIAACKCFMSM